MIPCLDSLSRHFYISSRLDCIKPTEIQSIGSEKTFVQGVRKDQPAPVARITLIPVPHHRDLRHGIFDFAKLTGRQFDIHCAVVFIQTLEFT